MPEAEICHARHSTKYVSQTKISMHQGLTYDVCPKCPNNFQQKVLDKNEKLTPVTMLKENIKKKSTSKEPESDTIYHLIKRAQYEFSHVNIIRTIRTQ